jgi:3'-phosphoadenosine 5'-phosphosulfate sulfotransferase (PAPS reductase)/FAD synthetase
MRHILSISGGRDSAALAVFMKDKIDNVEYVFSDTGCEFPEVYEYLDKIENYLGQEIVRIHPEKTFEELVVKYNGFLPNITTRWCSRELKIKPMEKYIGSDENTQYVGIRYDERERINRAKHKKNTTLVYPFIDFQIDLDGVRHILEQSGLGIPQYYDWAKRSGCYFCFYKSRLTWIHMLEQHPDLYDKAERFESLPDCGCGAKRTSTMYWNITESLENLRKPERIAQIKAWHKRHRKSD